MKAEQILPSDGQSPVVEEVFPSGVGEGVVTALPEGKEGHAGIIPPNELAFDSVSSDEHKKLYVPVEVFNRLRLIPAWMSDGVLQQLEYRLCEMSVFSRLLEFELFQLGLKSGPDSSKLVAFADQAAALMSAAREALGYLHEYKLSLQSPELAEAIRRKLGNGSSEHNGENAAHCGKESDKAFFDDAAPIQ